MARPGYNDDNTINESVYTGPPPGYTGSGSQAGNNNSNNNNNDYTGQAIIDDIDQAQATNDIQNLIANKDKYQYLYNDNSGLNEYQKMMHALKTGKTYTSPGGIIPSNLMGLPDGINQGQQIGGMTVTGNPQGLASFKKRFPNPLVKIAQGVGNYIKQGGVLGILANALGGSKKAASKFTQNASTMAKDLAGMFGLDALMAKNLGIAAGSDSEEVNKFIQGQQAYDPSGLEGYKDKIYRDFLNQGKKNSLDPYGVPNPAFGTDQFDPKTYNDMLIMDQLEKENAAKKEDPFGFNLTDQFSDTINLTGDPNEEIENVSETIYDDKVNEDANMDAMPYAYPGLNLPRTGTYPDNPLAGMEGYPKVQPGINYGQGSENNFTDIYDSTFNNPNYDYGNIFSENISNTPALGQEINTFPGLEPDLSGFANGGYMSGFPNQNPAESLTASDNIDDRIMKNLQFEKMAPGMMGYNQGGKVMSTFEKLKAINYPS